MCNAFVTGFDIATQNGPLCEEPMLGSVFLIENIDLVKKGSISGGAQSVKSPETHQPDGQEEESKVEGSKVDSYGPFNG
jgi:translation elongation factor EF-G